MHCIVLVDLVLGSRQQPLQRVVSTCQLVGIEPKMHFQEHFVAHRSSTGVESGHHSRVVARSDLGNEGVSRSRREHAHVYRWAHRIESFRGKILVHVGSPLMTGDVPESPHSVELEENLRRFARERRLRSQNSEEMIS